jgi:hypothetical protein
MPKVAITAVPIVAIICSADDIVPVYSSINVNVPVHVDVPVDMNVPVHVDVLVDMNVLVDVGIFLNCLSGS